MFRRFQGACPTMAPAARERILHHPTQQCSAPLKVQNDWLFTPCFSTESASSSSFWNCGNNRLSVEFQQGLAAEEALKCGIDCQLKDRGESTCHEVASTGFRRNCIGQTSLFVCCCAGNQTWLCGPCVASQLSFSKKAHLNTAKGPVKK